MKKTVSLVAAMTIFASGIGTTVPIHTDAASGIYKNCTSFNKQYTKGVAKSANTKNKVINQKTKKASYKAMTKGTKVSATIYKTSIKNNNDLDRDKDGIACEK